MEPNTEIVSLGNFAGGSFGVQGDPRKLYEYFAVQEDVWSADGNPATLKAFRDRDQAEERKNAILDKYRQQQETEAARRNQAKPLPLAKWKDQNRLIAEAAFKKLGIEPRPCRMYIYGNTARVMIGSEVVVIKLEDLEQPS